MADAETSRRPSRDKSNGDDPPNSRLFVLCGRNASEEELRTAFEKFGRIEELWIVKDRNSGESKGVAYIKYAKTSEAAVAVEEMNGKFIQSSPRSLKVLIATSRDQGSKREVNEEERLLRLFIVVPKAMTEVELKQYFSQFGEVEHCNVVRGRNTKEGKGYAYVTFGRISHAAKAFEGCDRSFKPVFAEPRRNKQSPEEDRYSSPHSSNRAPFNSTSMQPHMNYGHHQHAHQNPHTSAHQDDIPARLNMIAFGSVSQDQLWRLCDFFPGLDYCNVRYDPNSHQCYATVVYHSYQAATYAREKLHGFEYPTGHRLIVKDGLPDPNLRAGNGRQHAPIVQIPRLMPGSLSAPQHHPSPSGESYDPSYCSVKLPAPQPLAPMDSPVVERLFIVCHATPPPIYALKDTFGRFGNLIDVFFLNGKNFGYAKYANTSSADQARKTLHGQEICGMRLKVMKAEPQDQKRGHSNANQVNPEEGDNGPKRARMDCDN